MTVEATVVMAKSPLRAEPGNSREDVWSDIASIAEQIAHELLTALSCETKVAL